MAALSEALRKIGYGTEEVTVAGAGAETGARSRRNRRYRAVLALGILLATPFLLQMTGMAAARP